MFVNFVNIIQELLFYVQQNFTGFGLLCSHSQPSTKCSAIAERPRCRVRYSFRQKYRTGTGRQYFTDIIGLSSTTVI